MFAQPTLLVLAPAEHWEVDDPQGLPRSGIDKVEYPSCVQSHLAQRLTGGEPPITAHQNSVAWFDVQFGSEFFFDAINELRNAALETILGDFRPRESACAV